MRITQIAPSRRGRPGVVTWAPLAPTTPPACAGTPPRAGGEFILLGALRIRASSLPIDAIQVAVTIAVVSLLFPVAIVDSRTDRRARVVDTPWVRKQVSNTP